MKKFTLSALLAAGTIVAGSANAATYLFTDDSCSGGCGASPSTPAGSVVTSQVSPGVVSVTVSLTNGGDFHDSNDPQHHALTFELAGSPDITISGLGAPFTANGLQHAGSHTAAGYGDFEYVINFPHARHPAVVSSYTFDVAATGLTPDSFISNGRAFFTSDIWTGPGQGGNTGNIAAIGAVIAAPEPATWSLMLAGLGGLGASLRSRRRAAAAA